MIDINLIFWFFVVWVFLNETLGKDETAIIKQRDFQRTRRRNAPRGTWFKNQPQDGVDTAQDGAPIGWKKNQARLNFLQWMILIQVKIFK